MIICLTCEKKMERSKRYILINSGASFCSEACWTNYAKQLIGFTWENNEDQDNHLKVSIASALDDILNEISKDLRVHGYCSILNGTNYSEEQIEKIQENLNVQFRNLIFVELDVNRKYFVVDENGKKMVLRLLDSTLYTYNRALKSDPNYLVNPNKYYESEIERITTAKKRVEKSRFNLSF